MNQVDRFQALIRHPDYRNDIRRADRLKFDPWYGGLPRLFPRDLTLSAAKDWCRRKTNYCDFIRVWGIAHPVDPEKPEEVAAALGALRAGDDSIFKDDFRGYETSELEGKADQHPERYLTLAVDLERPNKGLTEFFVAKVNEARKKRGIKRTQTKEYLADPWEVWDQMRLRGNTLPNIARAMYGTAGNPTSDPEIEASEGRVERAYQEAVALIDEVGRRRKTAATEQDKLFQTLELLTRAQFSGAIPECPRPACLDLLPKPPRPHP